MRYKTIKRAIIILFLAVFVLAVAVFGNLIIRPLRFSTAKISIENITDKLALESYIRQYDNNSLVSFKNDGCSFSSSDINDYCIVHVSANAYNRSFLTVGVKCLYPVSDNDFVIFGIIPVKTMEVQAKIVEKCYSSFICLKNGMTQEEIIQKMSEMKYTIVFGNNIVSEINTKTKLNEIFS